MLGSISGEENTGAWGLGVHFKAGVLHTAQHWPKRVWVLIIRRFLKCQTGFWNTELVLYTGLGQLLIQNHA